jgi:hypothetical protein
MIQFPCKNISIEAIGSVDNPHIFFHLSRSIGAFSLSLSQSIKFYLFPLLAHASTAKSIRSPFDRCIGSCIPQINLQSILHASTSRRPIKCSASSVLVALDSQLDPPFGIFFSVSHFLSASSQTSSSRSFTLPTLSRAKHLLTQLRFFN